MGYKFNPFSSTFDEVSEFDTAANYTMTGDWIFRTGTAPVFEEGITLGDTASSENRIAFDHDNSTGGYGVRVYQNNEDLGSSPSQLYVFEVSYFPNGGATGTAHTAFKADGTVQFGGRGVAASSLLLLMSGDLDDKAIGFTTIAQMGSSYNVGDGQLGAMTSGAIFSARGKSTNTTCQSLSASYFDLAFSTNSTLMTNDALKYVSIFTLNLFNSPRIHTDSTDSSSAVQFYGIWNKLNNASGASDLTSSRPLNLKDAIIVKNDTFKHQWLQTIAMRGGAVTTPPHGHVWHFFTMDTNHCEVSDGEVNIDHGGIMFRNYDDDAKYKSAFFRDRHQWIHSDDDRTLNFRSNNGATHIQGHDAMSLAAANMVGF